MEPIGNEPHGLGENQESHATHFGSGDKEVRKSEEIDGAQNDLAGNAVGNVPQEEMPDHKSEIADDDTEGFLGDFAEPQHDD